VEALVWLGIFALWAFCLFGFLLVFTKAGQPGWATFVPVYNLVILVQIACMSIWWVLALLIPGLNILAFIPVSLAIARRFGKSVAFGAGMALLPSFSIPSSDLETRSTRLILWRRRKRDGSVAA